MYLLLKCTNLKNSKGFHSYILCCVFVLVLREGGDLGRRGMVHINLSSLGY